MKQAFIIPNGIEFTQPPKDEEFNRMMEEHERRIREIADADAREMQRIIEEETERLCRNKKQNTAQ